MQITDFINLVVGGEGVRCSVSIESGQKKIQRFFDTTEELVQDALRQDHKGWDAYFALATFRDDSSRKVVNIETMKALYLDIDCGPAKDYPDKDTGAVALRAFCKELKLPMPTIVDSGRGLHVYWPLNNSVSYKMWHPVARSLKAACVALDLRVDPTATADGARVLRVPGTHNHKQAPALDVQILHVGKSVYIEELRAKLHEFSADEPRDMLADKPDHLRRMPKRAVELLSNRETSFKDLLTLTMEGRGCAQLEYAVVNQATLSEPMWRAALSIAKFCVEGEAAAHKISAGHPEYSKRETRLKLKGIAGPYTCARFDEYNPGICAECPHFGKVKSPISISYKIAEVPQDQRVIKVADYTGAVATREIPPFPPGYILSKGNAIYREGVDEEGNPRPQLVFDQLLYYSDRIHDPHFDGELFVGHLCLPHDPVREFMVTNTQASSQDDLRRVLAKVGVVATKKEWGDILAYSTAWLKHLQSEHAAKEARLQFGWTSEQYDAFLLGTRLVKAHDVEYSPTVASLVQDAAALGCRGTLEQWVENGKFFDRPGLEPWQFMVLFTIAAPLMAFTHQPAAMFNLFSQKSGAGKTTAQYFGLAAYGDPKMMCLGTEDTVNSVWLRAEKYRHLPMQWDELTNIPAEHVSQLVYSGYAGRQKNRMEAGKNAERYRGQPWSTTFGFSTNESLMQKIRNQKLDPDAETKRMLELEVFAQSFVSKAETDAFFNAVTKDYGFAGEVFLQYIMRNRGTVMEMILDIQSQIDKAADLKQADRFYSAAGTVVVVTSIIMKELELLSYDPRNIMDFTVGLIRQNKDNALELTMQAGDHLAAFITTHYGEILRIHGDTTSDNVRPDREPMKSIVGRYETDTKKFFWPTSCMRAYCTKAHIEYSSLCKELERTLGARKARIKLTKGLPVQLPAVRTYEIDCSGLDLGLDDDGGQTA